MKLTDSLFFSELLNINNYFNLPLALKSRLQILTQWHYKCLGKVLPVNSRKEKEVTLGSCTHTKHKLRFGINRKMVTLSLSVFFYSVRDNTNSLYLTRLHLTSSSHKQIPYFTVSMTTHDISGMVFKEGKVKITLGVKFFSFSSPILFIDTFRYNNFTFLSEFHCHFSTLDVELNECNFN